MWLLTTFEATYFDITRPLHASRSAHRDALGLFMNAAIGVAFTGAGGWAFVVPLVVTQIARTIITATTAPTAPLRQHYRSAKTCYNRRNAEMHADAGPALSNITRLDGTATIESPPHSPT